MSDVKPIQITDIAEFESVDVVEVLVKVGDEVVIEQPLVTVESEKAMMDYPSPLAGVVDKVLVQEGGNVKEGDTLITLKVTTEAIPAQDIEVESLKEDKAAVAEVRIENPISIELSSPNSTAYASPGTHKYARDLGVNLNEVQGTGRKHRIVEKDIQQHVQSQLQNGSPNKSKQTKRLDFSSYGGSSAEKLTKIQKLTAENMLNSWQNIPHVTHFDQADVTKLEKHRKQLANDLKAKQVKLTPLAFVIKALVVTLKQFPQFNTSLDSVAEELIYKDFFHIGIAVDTSARHRS